ncbi:MAG: group II truncated hemoglobin [Burkholderiales bacterium]
MKTYYETIGGNNAVKQLVERFYDLMQLETAYQGIRKLHPQSLDASREKLYQFLSGWLGGPPLYVERYGHPRLRARHLHVSIGETERDQWMACMTQAMNEIGVDEKLRKELHQAFFKTADFMRNV